MAMKNHYHPNLISHHPRPYSHILKLGTENIIPVPPSRNPIIDDQTLNGIKSIIPAFVLEIPTDILAPRRGPVRNFLALAGNTVTQAGAIGALVSHEVMFCHVDGMALSN